jgi:HK97 family phage major capsid protein
MNKLIKPFRHLIALLAVVTFAIITVCLGAAPGVGLLIIGLWQLSQFALSKRRAVCSIAALTAEQVEEFSEILRAASVEFPKLKAFQDSVKLLEKSNDELRREVSRIKKSNAGSVGHSGVRWIGGVPFVTDDCAKALTSAFVLDCARLNENAMARLVPDENSRLRVIQLAKSTLGVEQRAGGALSTSDIPLPTIYMPQIVELVFAFGAARQHATVFPLGSGLVKLPRLKAGEDDFGYLGAGTAGISQNIPQKEVQAELVTFTANKAGGLIRLPSELEEDTFIPIGQFLARYIARQLAKLEDKTLFLGDGTATYASQIGVGQYCLNNIAYLQQLAAGKVKVTDATLNDFRAMRGLVSPAVYANMAANGQTSAAYYLNPTLDTLLVTFNTLGEPQIYVRRPDGTATLDGFPIHWIGVSQAYKTTAAPNVPLAFFGDLSFWYLGERGSPRVEISREVFFQTDELAMRALERIDVEAMAIDAMSALYTAAS